MDRLSSAWNLLKEVSLRAICSSKHGTVFHIEKKVVPKKNIAPVPNTFQVEHLSFFNIFFYWIQIGFGLCMNWFTRYLWGMTGLTSISFQRIWSQGLNFLLFKYEVSLTMTSFYALRCLSFCLYDLYSTGKFGFIP